MSRLDDNRTALDVFDNMVGSFSNRIRQIYNIGYKEGVKDGKEEVIKSLDEYLVKAMFGEEALKKWESDSK